YRLMAWLSPAYPVGAFSYSSGIEWAVEAGDIKDADSLRRWLVVVIGAGGGFCDGVFFVHAHGSLADPGYDALRAVASLSAACSPRLRPWSKPPPSGRSKRRSARSAARRSAPTWQACCMKPSTRGCSAHDQICKWTVARRCRRAGRLRQDRADGCAVQAVAR